jgi:hypothetical protein
VNRIVLGSANAASISVGGAIQMLQINSVAGASLTAAGPIHAIQAVSWTSADIISAPSINAITIKGNATLNVSTAILHSLKVHGMLSNSTLTLTAGGALDVAMLSAGSISDSVINATGNLGTITTATLVNSQIYAGVATLATLPSAASDFSSASFINNVTLKKVAGVESDVNSSIAATLIKHVALANVQTNNNGTPFGLAATSISSLSLINPATGKSVSLSKLLSEDIVTADLAAKGITPQDFVIRIV